MAAKQIKPEDLVIHVLNVGFGDNIPAGGYKRHLLAQRGVFALSSMQCQVISRKAEPLAITSKLPAIGTFLLTTAACGFK